MPSLVLLVLGISSWDVAGANARFLQGLVQSRMSPSPWLHPGALLRSERCSTKLR